MHTDNALHVAIADGNVYFGSSVTNKVCSIDSASGSFNWTFFTEGPVRFAPTVADNRVYFGSDDGYVYCLDALNGSLIWKYRAGPGDEKVIGNGRMISLWPVRTSVLVDEGKVYFGAGVFPFVRCFYTIDPDSRFPIDSPEMQQEAFARPLPGNVKRTVVPDKIRLDYFLLNTRECRFDAERYEDMTVEFIRSTCFTFRADGVLPKTVQVLPPLALHHRPRVLG